MSVKMDEREASGMATGRVTKDLRDAGRAVRYDHENGVLVTWNGSATFNVWLETEYGWSNVDCFTVYGVESFEAAVVAAARHAGYEDGEDES